MHITVDCGLVGHMIVSSTPLKSCSRALVQRLAPVGAGEVFGE